MPTRYEVVIQITQELTFDAPDDMGRREVKILLEKKAKNFLKLEEFQIQILSGDKVSLAEAKGAPKDVLRVNDDRTNLTDEETGWIEGQP